MKTTVSKSGSLKGTVHVPGDKSISHRSAIIGAISHGETIVENFLEADDCLSTLNCLRSLGVRIEGPVKGAVRISGKGPEGLSEPEAVLEAGNSGTTMRLMMGVLAGRPFFSVITGDRSLNRRPMDRVLKPLTAMGASVNGRCDGRYAPLAIRGGRLGGIDYESPIPSAQVKSAVLLAGILAHGDTVFSEPARSRDHTERMLEYFGAQVSVNGRVTSIRGGQDLRGTKVIVPGDISSAAFMMVAASIVPGSDVTIKNVGTNPTRDGVIEVLCAMGADISINEARVLCGEPVADIRVRHSLLRGVVIEGDIIPRLIDELPVLAVAAAAAQGETVVSGARELRSKESDRIDSLAGELGKMGVDITARDDGFIIKPGKPLTGTVVHSVGDHRIAMTLAVAGLVAGGETVIQESESIMISYPGFFDALKNLQET